MAPAALQDPLALTAPADRQLDKDAFSRGYAPALGLAACPGVESVTPPRQDTKSWDVSSKRRSRFGRKPGGLRLTRPLLGSPGRPARSKHSRDVVYRYGYTPRCCCVGQHSHDVVYRYGYTPRCCCVGRNTLATWCIAIAIAIHHAAARVEGSQARPRRARIRVLTWWASGMRMMSTALTYTNR